MFEGPSRFTVGLERHILETIGFDFRVQFPQKLVIKVIRKMFPWGKPEQEKKGREVLRTGYDMSIDIYKTFAPIKQSSSTLAHAILELTFAVMGEDRTQLQELMGNTSRSSRARLYETMLDLLDLYTQFPKSTKVGPRIDLKKMMDVKIEVNKLLKADGLPRYSGLCGSCPKDALDLKPVTPGSATSPVTNGSLTGSGSAKRKGAASEGTLRFVFDAEEARKERDLVAEYTNDEYEEYEVEVEEPVREPETRPANNSRTSYVHRSGPAHNDRNWGPYNRGGRHPHPNDRLNGRKGPGHY